MLIQNSQFKVLTPSVITCAMLCTKKTVTNEYQMHFEPFTSFFFFFCLICFRLLLLEADGSSILIVMDLKIRVLLKVNTSAADDASIILDADAAVPRCHASR